jgi:hypothetical protein
MTPHDVKSRRQNQISDLLPIDYSCFSGHIVHKKLFITLMKTVS